MAITVVELRAFLKSKADDSQLERNLETAIDLLDTWLGTRKTKVPTMVYETAALTVAQQLYYRDTKDASSGGQYAQDGFATTIPKNPMHYAYPLLRPFVGWF